jgi:hypothetical protein
VFDIIRLSPDEAAKAKQAFESHKAAEDRWARGAAAWDSFVKDYQGRHPEMRGRATFSSDFTFAYDFGALSSGIVTKTDLSAEERQQGESSYRERMEASQALQKARNTWTEYQNELVARHIPVSCTGCGTEGPLPDGKVALIPNGWPKGIAFSPDFRIGVPRY